MMILMYLLCVSAYFRVNEELTTQQKNIKIDPAKLKQLSWEPIRIQAIFSSSQPKYEKLVEAATVYFSKHLMIKRSSTTIQFKSSYLDQYDKSTVPPLITQHYDQTFDADLVIFVDVSPSSESYVAAAKPLAVDSTTGRTIFGMMTWNSNKEQRSQTNIEFEKTNAIALHEIIHILGFSDFQFSYYYDSRNFKRYENALTSSSGQIFLTTPRVIEIGKKHFNCPSLDKVPLENQGTSGSVNSHFERTTFFNELMTSSLLNDDFAFSEFSLYSLVDSGFYQLSNYTADQLKWGKNRGCDFVDKLCDLKFNEFCDITQKSSTPSCSFSGEGVAVCLSLDSFLDQNCAYKHILQDCRDINQSSICINTQVGGMCVQYKCVNQVLTIVTASGSEFQCTSSSATINFQGIDYSCPENYQEICQFTNDCQNQCNSGGACVGGQCTCISGYSGKGCENVCSNFRYEDQCIEQCPPNTFQIDFIKYCLKCPAHCSSCTNYNQCSQCEDGYYLINSLCDIVAPLIEISGIIIQVALITYFMT